MKHFVMRTVLAAGGVLAAAVFATGKPAAEDDAGKTAALVSKSDNAMAHQDYDTAIALATAALERKPNDATAARLHYILGVSHYGREELEASRGEFDEAIRLDPKMEKAYVGRGGAYAVSTSTARRDAAKAVADYTEAMRLDPKDPGAFENFAWLLATSPDAKVRDGKKAVEYATRACELEQWAGTPGIETLAAAYAETGDFDKAVKFEEWALALTGEGDNWAHVMRSKVETYKARIAWRDRDHGDRDN